MLSDSFSFIFLILVDHGEYGVYISITTDEQIQ